MTQSQKKTLATCALAVMTFLSAGMILLAGLAATDRLIGHEPAGALFLSLSANFSDLGAMLKALSVLVLPGIAMVGTSCTSTRSITAMTVVLAAGITACVTLLLSVGSEGIAANLWGPSRVRGIHSYEELQTAARPLIIWTGGALSAALVAFLGISATKRNRLE